MCRHVKLFESWYTTCIDNVVLAGLCAMFGSDFIVVASLVKFASIANVFICMVFTNYYW